MGADRDYDSTGKGRATDVRTRSGLLLVALVTGMCLGVVLSERLYIRFQDQDTSLQAPGGGGSGASARRRLGQVITVAPF